jgi:hypothetical protein
MSATRGRAAFLGQVQRGFVLAGFAFVFGGVGGFVFLFIIHAQVTRLVPIALVTAITEGIGMFAMAIALEMVLLISPRWFQEKPHE